MGNVCSLYLIQRAKNNKTQKDLIKNYYKRLNKSNNITNNITNYIENKNVNSKYSIT